MGDDAYIVSTRKTGGQIEIVATDDNAAFKKRKPFVLKVIIELILFPLF